MIERMKADVQIKILDPRAEIPRYATDGSAGFDLRVFFKDDSPLRIAPNAIYLAKTGISVYLKNPHLVGLVFPRSGLGGKLGVVLGNLTGVIDSDYQGELMVVLWNRSNEHVTIQSGDRVAQYVIVPTIQAEFEVVEDFEATARGANGFGSTGKN